MVIVCYALNQKSVINTISRKPDITIIVSQPRKMRLIASNQSFRRSSTVQQEKQNNVQTPKIIKLKLKNKRVLKSQQIIDTDLRKKVKDGNSKIFPKFF